MAYLGKTPSQAVRSRYYFTASGGETSLAPAQVTGLSFTDANYVDVSLNGVALVSGTDYTATPSTNTISSLSALTASDVVEIVVYDTFSVFGGSVNGDFTISNGTLAAEAVTVTGLTTTGNINFGDNDKAIFGAGSDLQIYHDSNNSYVQDQGTGSLRLGSDSVVQIGKATAWGELMAQFTADGGCELRHDNAAKLNTTSTGVDVTGNIESTGRARASGSTGFPAFSHNTDTDTGMNPDGSGNIQFTTQGSEAMRITSGGNVGIGTTSPDGGLDIEKTVNTAWSSALRANDFLQISNASTTGGSYSGIELIATGVGAAGAAEIVCIDSGSGSGDLAFSTRSGSTWGEKVRILSGGNVGIGTSSPARQLDVFDDGTNSQAVIAITAQNTDPSRLMFADTDDNNIGILDYHHSDNSMRFTVNNSEGMRITSAGRVGIGTSSPRSDLELANSGGGELTLKYIGNTGYASIKTNSTNDLVFTGSATTAERMRIDSSGRLLVGKNSTTVTVSGFEASQNGRVFMTVDGDDVVINRLSSDGTVLSLRQNSVEEGNISVSGTTVSYNGGHLSRWSQATDGNRIDGLVKGTVMTNLDQMAVWTKDGVTEDNEQLNCMAVSSVEGDANVAGVFVNWDDDDEDYTADMNIAMTGDMVIRIASGTTVARGDLLMSAGDGTAKPQGDDIVRSKTIAKVTSTNVSHTYDDGTYLVPCVLMAC